jgi:hypothetical protein
MHPHPRIHDDATVIGALGLSEAQVLEVEHRFDEQAAATEKAALQRKMQLQKKARLAQPRIW